MFSNNDVVPSNEARPNSIFIFDDVACDKQERILLGWVAMRTLTASLCQTYARIPDRDNANLLILFKQNCINLKTFTIM